MYREYLHCSYMDLQVFFAINNLAGHSYILDGLGIFFAIYALPVLVGVLILLALRKHRLFLQGMFASILAYGMNALIGILIPRHRPFVDYGVAKLIEKSAESKSFPSDHAALAFAIAAVVAYAYPRWGWLLFICAILIALSRIYVGVHYPTDIIAGACVGILSAWVVHRIIRL